MKYTKAALAVIALLLASSVESTQGVQLESHSEHRHHQRQHHHGHGMRPYRQNYVELESRQLQNLQSRAEEQQLAKHKGILDMVQKKIEKEEKEQEQIRLAKLAEESEKQAYLQAEVIAKTKANAQRLQQREAEVQANVMIDQIKKGNINAQQLAQIMMGEIKLPTEENVESLPEVEAAPVTQEIAAPATPFVQPQVVEAPKQTELKKEIVKKALATATAPAPAPTPVHPPIKTQVMTEEPTPEELDGSISSYAELVREQKRQEEAKKGQGLLNMLTDKPPEAATPRPLTMTERAEQKFKNDEGEIKAQIDESLDNPLSQYYASRHPDILKEASERHYLTDHV